MKTKIIMLLVSVILLVNSQKVNSQSKDSLSIILNDKSIHDSLKIKSLHRFCKKHYQKLQFDSCEIYIKPALLLSEHLGDKYLIAKSNAILGLINSTKYNFPLALKHHFKSVEIYKELNDTLYFHYINQLNSIGYIYSVYGNYSESFYYYLKSLRLAEVINDTALILESSLRISVLYYDIMDFNKSIVFLNKSASLIKNKYDYNSYYYYSNLYQGYANNYFSKKEYYKSKIYYNKLIDIAITYKDSAYIGMGQIGLAKIYKEMNKYDSAIMYLKSSLLYIDRNNNAASYDILGDIYINQKKYSLAKKYINKSLEISKKYRFSSIIVNNYKNLYKIDSCNNNYKSYINNYNLFISYRDSLNNSENLNKIVLMELNFSFDKEKSLMKAKQDELNKVSELTNKRQRDFIIGVIILLIIFISISIFIYNIYLGKKKDNILITSQKKMVDEKQKEILDNITYAKRIQNSIIPSNDYISKYAKDNFVFYNPKDIVSGDFYWATEKDNKFYLATADCTGHGVSGAMVSMMNVSILNEVVNQKGVTDTGEILNQVRDKVIKSLNPKGNECVNDGMDCVLCAFDFNKKTLQYSASNNSFYIIRGKELIICKADKMPIGLSTRMDSFTTNEIQLQSGDIVYMFTDGYADQFGGEQNKKFKYKQLQELLIELSDKKMLLQRDLLESEFESWKGNNEQTDDVLIIGIKIN